jgi:hypothetical protein
MSDRIWQTRRRTGRSHLAGLWIQVHLMFPGDSRQRGIADCVTMRVPLGGSFKPEKNACYRSYRVIEWVLHQEPRGDFRCRAATERPFYWSRRGAEPALGFRVRCGRDRLVAGSVKKTAAFAVSLPIRRALLMPCRRSRHVTFFRCVSFEFVQSRYVVPSRRHRAS